MNLDKLFGGEQAKLSKIFSFMYASQCVLFERRKLTIPILDSKSSSLNYNPLSFKDKEEMIWGLFIFDIASFYNFYL